MHLVVVDSEMTVKGAWHRSLRDTTNALSSGSMTLKDVNGIRQENNFPFIYDFETVFTNQI